MAESVRVIRCKHCKRRIYESVDECPHCHRKTPRYRRMIYMAITCIALLVAAVAFLVYQFAKPVLPRQDSPASSSQEDAPKFK